MKHRPLIITSTALLVLALGASFASMVYGPSRADGASTPTPTSNRPPAEPAIVYFVNGEQGSATVTLGHQVTLQWVLYNRGQGSFSAAVDDAMFASLDGSCMLQPGMDCTQSAIVTFTAAGPIFDTVRVAANVPPASTTYAEDTVVINVVAPTPQPRLTGDFNCDGLVNAIDAALILQIGAGLAVPLPCTGDGDINHDGELNAIDASLILQYVAGLIPPFT